MVLKMNFLSKHLGMQTNVTVCLPSFSFADVMEKRQSVYVKGMKYQTLYLLHGGSGDDSDYVNFSNIVRYADNHKLAVVMPCDFNADYTDAPKGPRYLRYVTEELPEMLQAVLPLSDRREDNFIGGLSMGAHGAMKISLLYPERYAAVLVMSGAARSADTMDLMKQARPQDSDGMPIPDMEALYGDLAAFRGSKHDAYAAAEKAAAAGGPLPEYFFACGGNDFALPRCKGGYEALTKLGFATHYLEVPGYGHEWDFWDMILRKAIEEWLPIRHQVIYPAGTETAGEAEQA